MDRGARQATVHAVAKRQTQPSMHARFFLEYIRDMNNFSRRGKLRKARGRLKPKLKSRDLQLAFFCQSLLNYTAACSNTRSISSHSRLVLCKYAHSRPVKSCFFLLRMTFQTYMLYFLNSS